MAENREITLFSEPEELIAWAEVYDKQINPSIEDAALLLKGDLEKAAATIAQGIKDYSTDKRGR